MSSIKTLEDFARVIGECVKCGICQAHCPTYQQTRREGAVARGKIALAAALLGGEAGLEKRLREDIGMCLMCGSCEYKCPNKIPTKEIVGAIRRTEAVEVQYQSLSRPEPVWRWIAPHAIAFDGFRWHTRAFCLLDNCFKDFLLSRILETRDVQPSQIGSVADMDWAEQVDLVIGPHPDLSDTQRRVIELDYGMTGGSAKISVRRALLYYALRRLGLDSESGSRKPEEQQIVLLASSAEVRRAEAEM